MYLILAAARPAIAAYWESRGVVLVPLLLPLLLEDYDTLLLRGRRAATRIRACCMNCFNFLFFMGQVCGGGDKIGPNLTPKYAKRWCPSGALQNYTLHFVRR